MKNLTLPLLFCIFSTFISCSSKKENSIVGVWQHSDPKAMTIEFDKDGSYYLLKSNKRLVFEDSLVFKYSYKPEDNKEFNFVLEDNKSDFQYKGNLTFNSPDNIYLSLKAPDRSNIQGEYNRVKVN